KNPHYDEKATAENPRWFMVDVRLVRRFASPLPLDELRKQPELAGMELLRRGSRLSVQPVEEPFFRHIMAMAEKA
ncbi:MAG: EVE domain-containing protein, partial [Mailhella sp.]